MGRMSAVTISVQADSEAEALAWLEKLRALGLVPLGRPSTVIGRSRWLVRTQPEHDVQQAEG
jgi:hypothetical protein